MRICSEGSAIAASVLALSAIRFPKGVVGYLSDPVIGLRLQISQAAGKGGALRPGAGGHVKFLFFFSQGLSVG